MNLLYRSKRTRRNVALVLLGILFCQIGWPTVVHALTSGPMQPEYASYESPGARDMVSLITGDFQYSIPILEVPGPEGNFEIPLFYHSGIRNEDEATWVGLGWNINVGSIAHSVIGFPDDYSMGNGKSTGTLPIQTSVSGGGGTGWTDLHTFYQEYWDSEKGHSGKMHLLDFSVSWDKNGKDVGIAGIHHTTAGKTYFNLDEMGQAAMNAYFMVSGSFVSKAENLAVKDGITQGAEMAGKQFSNKALGINLASSVATDVAFGMISGQSNLGMNMEGLLHIESKKESKRRTSYRYWYQNSLCEMPFGSLYFQNYHDVYTNLKGDKQGDLTQYSHATMMLNVNGTSTIAAQFPVYKANTTDWKYKDNPHYLSDDVYVPVPDNTTDYFNVNQAVHIAYDAYNVMGPGISGSIKPYRHDMACVASPKKSSSYYYTQVLNVSDERNIKFKYTNDYSNFYTELLDMTGAAQTLGFSDRLSSDNSGYYLNVDVTDPNWNDHIIFAKYRYGANKMIMDASSCQKDYYWGCTRVNVPNGRNIEWFTTGDIRGIDTDNMTYHPAMGRIQLHSPAANYATFRNGDDRTLEAMAITDLQGITYHYAYHVLNKQEIFQATGGGSTFYQEDLNAYASALVLTGITGPDYVDGNGNYLIDNQDYGYWVKFNYATYSTPSWRFPYTGNDVASNGSTSSQSGQREQVYLNSVETRSHIALFAKSQRSDGLDASSTTLSSCIAPLKLDKILLFRKSDITNLTSSSSISRFIGCNWVNGSCFCDFTTNTLMTSDINATVESLAIKKIAFNYGYSLCLNTPNSNSSGGGKLTLNSVSTYGQNSAKIMPDYTFNYEGVTTASNPANSYMTAQDDFGYPATSIWNLNKVTMPTGSVLNVLYEKDDFASISGVTTGQGNITGGGSRVKEINVTDGIQTFRNKYKYSDAAGNSYGVVSKLPSKSSLYSSFNSTYPIHSHYDYPYTGVLYSKVTELSGKLSDDNDIEQKAIYTFQTPSFDMIQESQYGVASGTVPDPYFNDFAYRQAGFHIVDNTASIGTLQAIEVYDKSGVLQNRTSWQYTSNIKSSNNLNTAKYMGKFSEGAYLFEHDWSQETKNNFSFFHDKYKCVKTTKLRNPLVIDQVTVEKKGVQKVSKNEDWDFFSGLIRQSTESFPNLGKSITNVQVPAYSYYIGMERSQDVESEGLNMLSQIAYTYSYINGDPTKVIGANAQTWVIAGGVSRKKAHYTWYSNTLNPDGTFQNFVDFNFDNLSLNAISWVKTGEISLYDHFSHPLESIDINGNYAAMKYDNNSFYPISSATLATFHSFFHSSFEDLNSNNVFGGEVTLSTASQIASDGTVLPHTGNYLVKIASATTAATGPLFKASTTATNNVGMEAGRTYRTSVWIHTSSDPNATLFFSYQDANGTTTVSKKLSDASNIVATAGSWSLLRFDVTLPSAYVSAGNGIQIGVKGGTTKASYFDDLRVHPTESAISASTYDNAGRVSYTLNQDNYFTQYVYNDKGQLIQIWQETPTKGVVKIKEYSRHLQGE